MFEKKLFGLFIYPLCFGFLLAGSLPARAAESLEKAVSEAAASLGEKLLAANLKKFTVAEFTEISGYRSALGPFLADELTGQFLAAPAGAFEVVDRQQLTKELAARNLNIGALDAASTAEIGKAMGLQAIVTGTITDLGQQINVAIRAVSMPSGVIAAAISVRFPRSGAAETLLRQIGGSQGSAGILAGKQTQASDVFFRNNLIQLTVDSISFSNNKESIHLALALENLTDQDLSLHLVCRETSLTSSHGSKYLCDNVQGINGEKYYGTWTAFGPRSRSIISFSFDAGKNSTAGYYSFSTVFARPDEEDSIHFSAGISGIRLQDRPIATEKPNSRR